MAPNQSAPSIALSPLSESFGAEITGVDLVKARNGDITVLLDALDNHGAVLARNQDLSNETFAALSRRIGEIDEAPVMERGRTTVEGWPEIYIVSNVPGADGEPIGSLEHGEASWHTDMSHLKDPPYASALYAIEIPAAGGDTELASMTAAYESLPDDLARRARALSIKHDAAYNSGGYVREGATPTDEPVQSGGVAHPAVIRHPRTDKPALYLGRRRNAYIVGMQPAESEELLDMLWSHATRVEHRHKHRWRPGDLLIWENWTTLHRRDGFDPKAGRILHRTQMRSGVPLDECAYSQSENLSI